MKNLAAVIGLAIGAYIGWLLGGVADFYVAAITRTHPAHTYAMVTSLVMASLWSFTLWRVIGGLHARQTTAKSHVEHAEMKASRTGRTPPSPFPALQG